MRLKLADFGLARAFVVGRPSPPSQWFLNNCSCGVSWKWNQVVWFEYQSYQCWPQWLIFALLCDTRFRDLSTSSSFQTGPEEWKMPFIYLPRCQSQSIPTRPEKWGERKHCKRSDVFADDLWISTRNGVVDCGSLQSVVEKWVRFVMPYCDIPFQFMKILHKAKALRY